MRIKGFIIVGFLSFVLFSCSNSSEQIENVVESKQIKTDEEYLLEGKTIVENTFKALSGQLKQALAEGGIPNALSFCNVNAIPLTDSLSNKYNVIIKRTSDKPRNSLNFPTENEQKIIDDYLADAENRKPVLVKNEEGQVMFYAPILTKELCLNCHGKAGETLLTENHEIIKTLYPNDQAIGYDVGEFRGIWSIMFKEK